MVLQCSVKGGQVLPKPEWKTFPKLRNAPFRKCRRLFGEEARNSFAKTRLKFYRTKEGDFLAVGLRGWPSFCQMTVMKSNGEKSFAYEGHCEYDVRSNSVHMHDVESKNGRKTGIGLFRLFLNGAIAVAKKNGVNVISIDAANKTLATYYSRFGFEFEELSGKLFLPRRKH